MDQGALAVRTKWPRPAKKARNEHATEFLVFNLWLDWLAGSAPCPSRWPNSEFNRGPVEKLLGRVSFEKPGA